MLKLFVPETEFYDEVKEEFITTEGLVLHLEHSLVSVSKWESEFQKPFLSGGEKSNFETVKYIQCMVLSPEVSQEDLLRLTQENLEQINAYIESKYSATTFGLMPETKGRGETITSELVYYWMIAFNIPFECQHWHLNRLFALIRICNIKNSKSKKMSRREIASRNRELNAQRRAQLGTTG